jgi:protein arginine kinase activator
MNQKLCDHCGKEAAVINYHENKNGTVRDLHLCATCAAKLGIGIFQEDLFSHLSSFSLFSPTSQSAKKSPAYPLCGTTLEQIQRKGKFGCSSCYDTFRSRLDLSPYVGKGYQGKGKAVESAPAPKKENTLQEEIASLRAKLKKAVDGEHYEEAAKLRDEIRAKEGK